MHVGHWRRNKVLQRNRLYYDRCLGHLVGCQLHWRCGVHRLMPHASSVSKLQNARMMKKKKKPCVLRRLRPKTPSSEDGFRGSHASDRYSCFMDQCDKQKSAIGDHDLMCSSVPWATAHPRSLRPTSSIGSTRTRRSRAITSKQQQLSRIGSAKHTSLTLTNLLWEVLARPVGSCRDKDDPDSEMKVVVSPILK